MKDYSKRLENLLSSEVDPAYKLRARLILKQVLALQPKTILDAGCGRGFYTQVLSSLPFVKQVVGLDLNADYLNQIKDKNNQKLVYLNQDLSSWNTNKRFDLIIVSEVLEHLANDQQTLIRVSKLLKPGGIIIITVPHEKYPFFWDPVNYLLSFFGTHLPSNVWWLAGIWADHLRLYSKKRLEIICTNARLKEVYLEEQVHFCWPFSHFLLYGVGKNLVLTLNLNSLNRFIPKPTPTARLLSSLMSMPDNVFTEYLSWYKRSFVKRFVGLAGVYQKMD